MKRCAESSSKSAKKPRLARARRSPRKVKPKSSAQNAQTRIDALERELAAARGEQTATSEVLNVISRSPGELEPVFDSVLENAVRICEANFGTLYSFDGQKFHAARAIGTPQAL